MAGSTIGVPQVEVEDLFNFGRKKARWRDLDYLELVPAHHQAWEHDEDTGKVRVLLPRYTDPIFGRLLQPRLSSAKSHIKVALEDRGAYLWRLMDGKRTVADLARAFESDHPEDSEDVPKRISLYLHAMYENNFIKYMNFED